MDNTIEDTVLTNTGVDEFLGLALCYGFTVCSESKRYRAVPSGSVVLASRQALAMPSPEIAAHSSAKLLRAAS
jgi:hypothetical protein